ITTTFSKNPSDSPSDDKNALYSFGAFLTQPINPNFNEPRGSEWIGIDLGTNLIIAILQTQPFSKGFVNIQNNDYLTTPLVSEEALKDPRDMQFFIDLIRNQLIPIANQLNNIDLTYILQARL